jgi:uncharacterized protein (DUF433 family)
MGSRRYLIDWNRVLRLYHAGWTHAEIARLYGCHAATVGQGLRERGERRARRWSRSRRRHGLRLYGLWRYLIARCDDPSHPQYPRFGAKGIRFGRAWRDFDAFYDWAMAAGYAPGLRLDRIVDSRDFTPGNCRWVREDELLAKRPRLPRVPFLIRAFGESKGQMAWARDPRCRVKQSALRGRLAAGWTPEEAITAPPGSKPSRLVRPPKLLLRPRRTRARIDWREACLLYLKEGLSEEEIARRYGATPDAVARGLGRHGVRRPRPKPPTLDLEWRRLEKVWRVLLRRCAHRFGTRGMRVTPQWNEFSAFYAWARSSGARKNLSIARKNPRWGWSPGNCEWIPRYDPIRRRRTWS